MLDDLLDGDLERGDISQGDVKVKNGVRFSWDGTGRAPSKYTRSDTCYSLIMADWSYTNDMKLQIVVLPRDHCRERLDERMPTPTL